MSSCQEVELDLHIAKQLCNKPHRLCRLFGCGCGCRVASRLGGFGSFFGVCRYTTWKPLPYGRERFWIFAVEPFLSRRGWCAVCAARRGAAAEQVATRTTARAFAASALCGSSRSFVQNSSEW